MPCKQDQIRVSSQLLNNGGTLLISVISYIIGINLSRELFLQPLVMNERLFRAFIADLTADFYYIMILQILGISDRTIMSGSQNTAFLALCRVIRIRLAVGYNRKEVKKWIQKR